MTRQMSTRSRLAALCVLAVTAAASLALADEPAAAPSRLASQEAELRDSLATTAATVVHASDSVTLNFPVRLAFSADRDELLPAGTEMLDAVAHSLKDYRRTRLVITVYTDAIGSSEFNQQQSQARAAAVLEYLRGQGVEAERMIARGAGEGAQLAAPNTAEGRDLNRRLELTITTLSS
jgi:outer membrane protein OmpA-like peptidoglycan-associated protein